MLILIAPFFLPIDRHIHQKLMFYSCAFPGLLFLLLKPSILLKPVFIGMITFIAYFSLQDLRGLLPLTPALVKWQCIRAFIIMGPAFILSGVSSKRRFYLFATLSLILIATSSVLYSLFSFYSENFFPAQRFVLLSGVQHPGHSALKCGLLVIFTGAFFLLNRKKLKGYALYSTDRKM